MHMRNLSLVIGAIATVVSTQAAAQAFEDEDAQEVDDAAGQEIVIADYSKEYVIVVEAGLLPAPMSDSSAKTTLIEYPAQDAGSRVENILRSIPGLGQFRRSDSRSANPTSQGVTMRGLGGNAASRAVVMLDGVPQADPFGGWVNWAAFDTAELNAIRVLHGGGGGIDGPGALAGTIHLLSQLSSKQSGSIAYGSRNSLDADFYAGTDLGRGEAAISAGVSRGDGFAPIREGQRGSADRNAPYRSGGINLRLSAPLNGKTRLETTTRWFTDKRDRGFDFSESRQQGIDANIRLINQDYEGLDWTALAYVQTREFSSQFASVSANRSTTTPTLDQYDVPSSGLGAKLELRFHPAETVEVRVGSDWRRTSGETRENFTFVNGRPTRNRRAGGQADTAGAYADLSFDAGDRIFVSVSGRLDHWSLSGGFRREVDIGGAVRSDDRFVSRSGWETSGRIGASADLGTVELRSSAYAGWRLPTLNELYRPFRVGLDAVAANEALAPEKLLGFDFGGKWRVDDLSVGMTFFWNQLDNAVANVTVGRGAGVFPGVGFVAAGGIYRQRLNIDRLASKGLELEANWGLGSFSINAAYSYVDAEMKGTTLSGLRPAQVPAHSGRLGAGYNNHEGLSFGVSLNYQGKQFEDDQNILALDEAATVDAFARIGLTDSLTLVARAENLSNAKVQAAISNTGIVERVSPRTIWFGLRFAPN